MLTPHELLATGRLEHLHHADHSTSDGATAPAHPETLSPLIAQYVATIEQAEAEDQPHRLPTLEVSEGLGMLAFAYEKLRNSVEYREEHLLLRNAIKRILRRRMNALWQHESVAASLLRELIWARYLPNDSVPQQRVVEIERLLRKYDVLRQAVSRQSDKENWQEWILGLIACDIEATLIPQLSRYALAEVMYQWMLRSIEVDGLVAADRPVQYYVAVHRALLRSDRTALTYHLFLLNAPSWATADTHDAEQLLPHLEAIRTTVETQLNHPLAQDLTRVSKRYTPPFLVLADVVRAHPAQAREVLANNLTFKRRIEEVCQLRYRELRQRVTRAIVRSMIYILITKMVLALLLEVPYDQYFYHQINYVALAINILFPPLLMVVLGLSTRVPGPKNTEAIVTRLSDLVTGNYAREFVAVGAKTGRLSPVGSFIYLLVSLGSFALLAWGLWRFGFTIIGIGLFLLFFCVVLFFAYRVRQVAREVSVIRERENIVESIVTFFTLPFLRLGYYLSASFGKMNIFVFILDFLLEAPFKLILDMAERWLTFVREKREELVDSADYS